jgi:hypothetical protein
MAEAKKGFDLSSIYGKTATAPKAVTTAPAPMKREGPVKTFTPPPATAEVIPPVPVAEPPALEPVVEPQTVETTTMAPAEVEEQGQEASSLPVVQEEVSVPAVAEEHTGAIIEADGKSIISAKFGAVVSRYPIDRFKAVKGLNSRIAIIDLDITIVRTHYIEKMGYLYCFGGSCCEGGLPSVRYIVPIMQYDTDKTGNLASAKFTVKFLMLPQQDYDAMTALYHSGVQVDHVDFVVTCDDENFQKNRYGNVGPAQWRKHPQFQAAVLAEYASLKKFIPAVIGRKMDEESFQARLAEISGQGQQQQSPRGSRGGVDLSKFKR